MVQAVIGAGKDDGVDAIQHIDDGNSVILELRDNFETTSLFEAATQRGWYAPESWSGVMESSGWVSKPAACCWSGGRDGADVGISPGTEVVRDCRRNVTRFLPGLFLAERL